MNLTDLLEEAVARTRALPPSMQDEFAGVMLALLGDDAAPVALSNADREAIERGRMAAEHGDFASDDEMRMVWERYGA